MGLFIFGVFITLIVAAACGTIIYGIQADKKERETRENAERTINS